MKLSSSGIVLLEQLEGKRNTMYLDSAGKATIGIGHLILPTEAWMKTATLTDAQVYEILRNDIARFELAVSHAITVELCQAKFDALVIFAFNIGTGAFGSSTAVRRINAKETPEQIAEAWAWFNKAGGQVIPGLVARRATEIDLFQTGCEKKSSNDTLSSECSREFSLS